MMSLCIGVPRRPTTVRCSAVSSPDGLCTCGCLHAGVQENRRLPIMPCTSSPVQTTYDRDCLRGMTSHYGTSWHLGIMMYLWHGLWCLNPNWIIAQSRAVIPDTSCFMLCSKCLCSEWHHIVKWWHHYDIIMTSRCLADLSLCAVPWCLKLIGSNPSCALVLRKDL